MGMSTEMAPTYISMNPAGQMAYILDTNSINLTPVQLAVPGSEILLIQDGSKTNAVYENATVLTDVAAADSVAWLGNNVLVLVSQPQEYIVVEQEVVVDSNAVVQAQPVEVMSNAAVTQLVQAKENSVGFAEAAVVEEPASTEEDAKCWFRDSLITTAALSKLTNYVQSNTNAKIG